MVLKNKTTKNKSPTWFEYLLYTCLSDSFQRYLIWMMSAAEGTTSFAVITYNLLQQTQLCLEYRTLFSVLNKKQWAWRLCFSSVFQLLVHFLMVLYTFCLEFISSTVISGHLTFDRLDNGWLLLYSQYWGFCCYNRTFPLCHLSITPYYYFKVPSESWTANEE